MFVFFDKEIALKRDSNQGLSTRSCAVNLLSYRAQVKKWAHCIGKKTFFFFENKKSPTPTPRTILPKSQAGHRPIKTQSQQTRGSRGLFVAIITTRPLSQGLLGQDSSTPPSTWGAVSSVICVSHRFAGVTVEMLQRNGFQTSQEWSATNKFLSRVCACKT